MTSLPLPRALRFALTPRFADFPLPLVQNTLVDDRAFASARAERLLARGASPRLIAAHLRGKGIAQELIKEGLARVGDGGGHGA